MFSNKFFKLMGVKIFLTGFALVLGITVILVLEIQIPYIAPLWWLGFVMCLIGIILAVRDVIRRHPTSNNQKAR